MTKEFRSDLGRRVAERTSRGPSKKLGLLATAFATFALVFATAAYAYAMSDETNAPMTEYVIFNGARDDLTVTETNDQGETIERTIATSVVNLKVKGDHDWAGPNCPMLTAKFNYVTNVVILSDDFDPEAQELGRIILPSTANDGTTSVNVATSPINGAVVICDALGTQYTGTIDVSSEITLNGIELSVNLPTTANDALGNEVSIDYGAGYTVSIVVSFQMDVGVTLLEGLGVSQTAWGDPATETTELID